MQFRPLAMMRAVVVLPVPRMPVSMKACAMRSASKAFFSVRTMASCPIRSAKVCGAVLARQNLIAGVGGVAHERVASRGNRTSLGGAAGEVHGPRRQKGDQMAEHVPPRVLVALMGGLLRRDDGLRAGLLAGGGRGARRNPPV
jgi:hypothetical protein